MSMPSARMVDELANARAALRRFYSADGSFIELEPDEVVRRRIAAAAELARLREAGEALARENSELRWTLRALDSHHCMIDAPEGLSGEPCCDADQHNALYGSHVEPMLRDSEAVAAWRALVPLTPTEGK